MARVVGFVLYSKHDPLSFRLKHSKFLAARRRLYVLIIGLLTNIYLEQYL